jgi:hypothetical protein
MSGSGLGVCGERIGKSLISYIPPARKIQRIIVRISAPAKMSFGCYGGGRSTIVVRTSVALTDTGMIPTTDSGSSVFVLWSLLQNPEPLKCQNPGCMSQEAQILLYPLCDKFVKSRLMALCHSEQSEESNYISAF